MTQLPIPLYALVLTGERRPTRTGRYYWSMMIKTQVGDFLSVMWDAPEDAATNPKVPHSNDIIQITSYQNHLAEHNNICIDNFARIVRTDLPEEAKCIVDFPKASPEELADALGIIQNKDLWKNKEHYKFTMDCLQEADFEKFKICPAAERVHHNYQGGLVVHTSEVLELCHSIYTVSKKRYPFTSPDVLYTSAVLHDIGKIRTYSINDVGIARSDITEKTIGHIYYSMSLTERVYDRYKSTIKQSFINEVLHCIAAHHGNPEYGSIKKVQSGEAGILSRADYISSRNGMMESVLKESARTKQIPPEEYKLYGEMYFVSDAMREYLKTT